MEPILHRAAGHHGTTRGRLRNSEYAHPVNGVSISLADAKDLVTVCTAVALALPPDAVFTHLTAARLRGWWLPRIDDEPVIACTDGEAPHHDRRGVYIRRCDLPDRHRERLHGLQVASPEWTIVELAEHLRLVDLVVAIDCALHLGDTTLPAIRDTMRAGRRGVRVLRRALLLADSRSQSPWETVLRLLHVFAGIAVEPQHELRSEVGEVIWSLDLLISDTRRAAEFDGGVHRDAEVHLRDMRRDRLLAQHGIERFAYGARDVLEAPGQIVRDAEDALRLPHDARRLGRWQTEFRLSTFSPSGYGALLHRIDRFARPTSPRSRRSSGAK
jgi:very-short-patch-repair endonuclease